MRAMKHLVLFLCCECGNRLGFYDPSDDPTSDNMTLYCDECAEDVDARLEEEYADLRGDYVPVPSDPIGEEKARKASKRGT